MTFPLELDLLSESVFSNCKTLDSRRFAEEFIRRRRLADKGIIPEASSSPGFVGGSENKGNGGWSEVAKKPAATTAKEETSSQFKVVAARKKNKK